jgi:hypothetical protein
MVLLYVTAVGDGVSAYVERATDVHRRVRRTLSEKAFDKTVDKEQLAEINVELPSIQFEIRAATFIDALTRVGRDIPFLAWW